MSYTKILKECIKIADERQEQYGEATESLKICSNILKEVFKLDLSISDICHVLVALKLSRQANAHKDDNLLDVVNYLCISLYSKRKKDDKK